MATGAGPTLWGREGSGCIISTFTALTAFSALTAFIVFPALTAFSALTALTALTAFTAFSAFTTFSAFTAFSALTAFSAFSALTAFSTFTVLPHTALSLGTTTDSYKTGIVTVHSETATQTLLVGSEECRLITLLY